MTATAALETRAPTPPRRDEADTGLAQSTLSHQARCSVHISKGISTGSSSETQTRVASSQPNPVRLGNCAPPEQSSQPVDGQPDPSPQNLRCFQFSPSTVPLSTSTAEESHANESQLHQVTPEGLPQSLKMTLPVAGTWTLWSQNAEQLIKHANTLRSGIGGPRAALLLKACSKRDIVYIVLHQLFCEVYRDPPGFFARFPALGNEHCVSGMHKLADLLADNSALPRALVDAFCDYPWAIGKTVQASWFPAVFEMVRDCLMKLADRLTVDAIRHFYERGYPPLVMELTQQYCAKSPVLCEVIFLSTCRRLYEHWKIDLLERIYHKNQFLVDRNAPEKAIAALIEDYRAVPMKHGLCAAPGESQLSSSHNLNRVARQTGGATKSRGDDAQFNQPGSSTAPSPTQRQNEAAAQRPGSVSQSYMPSSSTASSSTLPLNGQQVPANLSPLVQPPLLPSQEADALFSRHIWDARDLPISAQEARQTRPAIRDGFQTLAAMSPPVNARHRQGADPNISNRPTHMVALTAAPHVAGSALTSDSHAQPSPSQSQNVQTVPGWHNYFSRPQQPQPSQYVQYLQNQQFRSSQSTTPGTTTARPAADRNSTQTSLMSRSSHSRNSQFPSIRPVPVSSPRVQMSQSQPVQSRSAGISPLLPPEGYRAPLTVQPQPMRLGIHQADLRDPVKQLVKKTPDGVEDIHLYQYLGEFLIRPTGVDPEVFSYRWKVSISASDYQRISRPVQRENGQRSLQVYQSGSRIYRLRIISVPNSQTQSIETIWSTASTTWPSVMYIFVNQNEMYVRRKVHNGKDLPLDISAHLREGENEVNLHFLLGPGECRSTHYEAAVEIMEICEYDEILAQIRRRPACETRADITKRLSSRIDDDELAIVTDSLTVPLIDPFMAQVFKVPVRSVNCTHIECFDLEAFVTTRKSNSGSQPLNDNWLCPVCKADARPQLLVIDEFFVDVREALERGGLIENAQSIQVGANGTWTVKSVSDELASPIPSQSQLPQSTSSAKRKVDKMTGNQEQSQRAKQASPAKGPFQSPSIIELD